MPPAPTGGSALPAPPETRRDEMATAGIGLVRWKETLRCSWRRVQEKKGAFDDGAAPGGGGEDPVEAEHRRTRDAKEGTRGSAEQRVGRVGTWEQPATRTSRKEAGRSQEADDNLMGVRLVAQPVRLSPTGDPNDHVYPK
jgi:hypothetical protein